MKATLEQYPVEYQAECPECGEPSFSDIDTDGWQGLEWGDGLPYGVLTCSECNENFEI